MERKKKPRLLLSSDEGELASGPTGEKGKTAGGDTFSFNFYFLNGAKLAVMVFDIFIQVLQLDGNHKPSLAFFLED